MGKSQGALKHTHTHTHTRPPMQARIHTNRHTHTQTDSHNLIGPHRGHRRQGVTSMCRAEAEACKDKSV